MPERSITLRLDDIVRAIEVIQRETVGVSLETFDSDIRKRWLVERGIEIISKPADICRRS